MHPQRFARHPLRPARSRLRRRRGLLSHSLARLPSRDEVLFYTAWWPHGRPPRPEGRYFQPERFELTGDPSERPDEGTVALADLPDDRSHGTGYLAPGRIPNAPGHDTAPSACPWAACSSSAPVAPLCSGPRWAYLFRTSSRRRWSPAACARASRRRGP